MPTNDKSNPAALSPLANPNTGERLFEMMFAGDTVLGPEVTDAEVGAFLRFCVTKRVNVTCSLENRETGAIRVRKG